MVSAWGTEASSLAFSIDVAVRLAELAQEVAARRGRGQFGGAAPGLVQSLAVGLVGSSPIFGSFMPSSALLLLHAPTFPRSDIGISESVHADVSIRFIIAISIGPPPQASASCF